MNEDEIFDLSRNIMGDIWLIQNQIGEADTAVGELEYEAAEEENRKHVNKAYRAVYQIEKTARSILNEIEQRAPEGYLEKEEE